MLYKKSKKKLIREKIGKLHLEYLLSKRGRRCEICGKPDTSFARFHILTVSAHPRLEFSDNNVIVYGHSHWFTCHEPYHHDRDSFHGQRIMKRIIELRGKEYKQNLIDEERYTGKMSGVYLLALHKYMEGKVRGK